jgi:hypothetical protein
MQRKFPTPSALARFRVSAVEGAVVYEPIDIQNSVLGASA